MNLMRQRDDLKKIAAAGLVSPGLMEKALSAPVFQWWSGAKSSRGLSETEVEFVKSYLIEEVNCPAEGPDKPACTVEWPRMSPYECFRISYMDEPLFDQWWIEKDWILCLHCDDGFSHKDIKTWTTHVKEKNRIAYWKMGIWVNEQRVRMPSDWGDEDQIHEIELGRITMKMTKHVATDYAGNVLRMLGIFMFDIYGSGNCVVKVSPKPDPTKSVQWRQAREHYLVLRRQQVEKLRETKGHVIEEDIVRSAHWRRAHLRRLSSGKFVNKRGLLVPVKRAWVGPTEWQGHDGKIYTVVGFEPKSLT